VLKCDEGSQFALGVERRYVDRTMASFVGRKDMLRKLRKNLDVDWTARGLPVVVVGEPGTGKTSLLCAFCHYYRKLNPDATILPHIVFASPRSTDIVETLLRLGHMLQEQYGCVWDPDDSNYQALKDSFKELLVTVGREALAIGDKILLLVDGVDSLDAAFGAHSLDWLPKFLPPGVRVLLSWASDSAPAVTVASWDPTWPSVDMIPLNVEERRRIVTRQLAYVRSFAVMHATALTRISSLQLLSKEINGHPNGLAADESRSWKTSVFDHRL